MQFGLLVSKQHPVGGDSVARLQEAVEDVRLARDLGFGLIVCGQRFLSSEYESIQTAVAAARLAVEAGSMRIATTYLLPLLNPVAVAEETASLDILTGGRLVFSVAMGYRQVEDRAFGLEPGRRVARLRAHLEVVKRLWTGRPVDFDAEYCHLAGATMGVRPLQRPHPPIWVAANHDRAVERAAEIGDTWFVNPHATLATLRRQMGLYRAALARHGKPFPTELPVMREVCVADSRAEALRLARPSLEQKYRTYLDWGQDKALPEGDDLNQAFEQLMGDRFIIGDPACVADEIQRYADEVGVNTMIFRTQWPGMPREAIRRTLRLLAEQVRPRLRAAA